MNETKGSPVRLSQRELRRKTPGALNKPKNVGADALVRPEARKRRVPLRPSKQDCAGPKRHDSHRSTKNGAGKRLRTRNSKCNLFLKFPKKLTRRTRDINPARYTALAIFHTLHNACWLVALRTIRAFGGVHHFLPVRCLRTSRPLPCFVSPDSEYLRSTIRATTAANESGWGSYWKSSRDLRHRPRIHTGRI